MKLTQYSSTNLTLYKKKKKKKSRQSGALMFGPRTLSARTSEGCPRGCGGQLVLHAAELLTHRADLLLSSFQQIFGFLVHGNLGLQLLLSVHQLQL